MSTLRSAGGKGSLYTDASWRTAAIRKNAILAGQIQKGGSGGSGVTTVGPSLFSSFSPILGGVSGMMQNIDMSDEPNYNNARELYVSSGGSFPVNVTITGFFNPPGGPFSGTLIGVYPETAYVSSSLGQAFENDNYTGPSATITISYGSGSGNILSAENQAKKPLISEHHLQKGFTSGVTEVLLGKNKNGFI